MRAMVLLLANALAESRYDPEWYRFINHLLERMPGDTKVGEFTPYTMTFTTTYNGRSYLSTVRATFGGFEIETKRTSLKFFAWGPDDAELIQDRIKACLKNTFHPRSEIGELVADISREIREERWITRIRS